MGYDGGMDDRLNNSISLGSRRKNKGLGQGIPLFAIAHAHQFAWNRTYPLTSLHTLVEWLRRIDCSEF